MFIVALHNNQKVGQTHMSIDKYMEKQNIVYINNGMLFSFKKEGNPDTCYYMDNP